MCMLQIEPFYISLFATPQHNSRKSRERVANIIIALLICFDWEWVWVVWCRGGGDCDSDCGISGIRLVLVALQ